MKSNGLGIALLLSGLIFIVSCQKEKGFMEDENGGGGNGGGGNCNNTVMKLKKWQATFDANHYIEATWNTDNTIQSVTMNVPLSDYRKAVYLYEAGKIKEAVLYDNNTGVIEDTVVFHYDAAGKVDSMYMKNDDWFDIKLSYTNGRLSKYTRYASGSVMFYWNITTDAKDNITKAEEFWNNSGVFTKETTYTFTRDSGKNPFAGIAQYLMYLDDDYNIFWYWGPNNYTDQRYQDHTGSGIDLTTGYKFKYNNNCYPISAQNTIAGQVIFTDDDFTFTYY